MCIEGGCCGPCCSARSWFVTHVIFVIIGAIITAYTIAVITYPLTVATNASDFKSRKSSSSSFSYDYSNSYLNDYSNDYETSYSNGDIAALAKSVQNILIVQVIAVVFRIVWSILGSVLLCCSSSKRVHIAYVVICGLDFVINICMIIVTKVRLVESGGQGSGMKTLMGFGIINIAIMDIAPMLCFCMCQKKTLSMYSDGVDPTLPTGQGVVYAAGPQIAQVCPNPSAVYPGNPYPNAGDPHGSNGLPTYTEVQNSILRTLNKDVDGPPTYTEVQNSILQSLNEQDTQSVESTAVDLDEL